MVNPFINFHNIESLDELKEALVTYYVWTYYYTHRIPMSSRDNYYRGSWLNIEEILKILSVQLNIALPQVEGFSFAKRLKDVAPVTVNGSEITREDILRVSQIGDVKSKLIEWGECIVKSIKRMYSKYEVLPSQFNDLVQEIQRFNHKLYWE